MLVEIWCNVMAQEGKERGDGEGFITVAQDLEVYRVLVV